MTDFAEFTDPGPRAQNEDATLAEVTAAGNIILTVADGLGGHFGGAEASRVAIETIRGKANVEALSNILEDIHNILLSKQAEDPKFRGMATTVTAVTIDGSRLVGAHCGDTRCVVQRGMGIKRLTTEHTEAQRLLASGKLTKAEFLSYPRRNILDRALGAVKKPLIDNFNFSLEKGDKVIITSDGVHEKLLLREMLDLLTKAETAKHIVETLALEVLNRVPEDNFSIVAAVI